MSGDRPHRLRRRILLGALALVVLVVGALGAYAWTLNSKLNDVERISIDTIKERPDPDSGRDLTILLLGSDKREDEDEALSDTLMVVHVAADRKRVTVVSIPRDTLTTVYDEQGTPQGEGKINSAFGRFGAAGAIATVEQLTDLRMDHLAIIDWAGFKELSTAVGGVPVTIPEAFCDEKQDKCWEARDYLLEGNEALQYVRTRDGLLRSDFARIERQQNFMRSLMKELLESGSLFKPLEFNEMLGALTSNLTVDEGWENGDIRSLAISLRGTKASDVTFLTTPVAETPTVPEHGSVVLLQEQSTAELFRALRDDKVQAWVAEHPDAVLPEADKIK